MDKSDITVHQDEIYYLIATDTIKSKYVIHTTGTPKPFIEFHISISGVIEETKNEISGHELRSFEKIAEEELPKQIVHLLKKLQEAGVDPIGFGLKYRARHFNNQSEWQEWEQLYPALDFKVKVHVKLRGTGVIE